MPVPASYVVALCRSTPTDSTSRIIIDVGSRDTAVCAQCQTSGHVAQHMAHVLVPLRYTPLEYGEECVDGLDAPMAEAIMRGDTMCTYPVHESCLELWGMRYLRMPQVRAQYIASKVQHRRDILTRIQYIDFFLRNAPQAHILMQHAQATVRQYPMSNCVAIKALRDAFRGIFSFYALCTIDTYLRHHNASSPQDCVNALYYVWQRENEIAQENMYIMRTQAFSVTSIDRS